MSTSNTTRTAFVVVLLLAFVTEGCCRFLARDGKSCRLCPSRDHDEPCVTEKAKDLRCPTACPKTERVKVVPAGEDCIEHPGWATSENNFQNQTTCHYSLKDNLREVIIEKNGRNPEYAELDSASILEDLEIDVPDGTQSECIVYPTSDGSSLSAKVAQHAIQAEILNKSATVATNYNQTTLQSSVRVAIIDTTPNGSESTGHGRMMMEIARKFACEGDVNCSVDFQTYRGLPRRYKNGVVGEIEKLTDNETDGHFGFQSDIAVAVREAVHDWKMSEKDALVINLSIGWEPGCTDDQDILKIALREAAEEGALILAAAGNRPPGTCASGLTGPAHWSDELVPSSDRPLLYGISAVGPHGVTMSTQRLNSQTAHAALGYGAVVEVNGEFLGPLSGTSVATASAAGLAARVWAVLLLRDVSSMAPANVGPQDVMDLLSTTRVRIGDPDAEESLGGTAPSPQPALLNSCQAIREACASNDLCEAECDSSSDITAWPGPPDLSDAEAYHLDGTDSTLCTSCEVGMPTYRIGNFEEAPPTNPWVVPQPGQTVCSDCGLVDGTLLYAQLDDSVVTNWGGAGPLTLANTTVEIVYGANVNNHVVRQYAPNIFGATHENMVVLTDNGLNSARNDNASAMIHFQFRTGKETVYFSEVLPLYTSP